MIKLIKSGRKKGEVVEIIGVRSASISECGKIIERIASMDFLIEKEGL